MADILIIEDDAHVALTVQATLAMAGYRCDILPDGRDAVARAASGKYDLLLLDVMLPGEDGFALMEKLRDCGVPVIFLTARQDVLDKVSGLRLGAEDYIRHIAFKNGKRVALTPKEFDMLGFLMQHVDVAVTREQLLQAVWGYNFMGETRTVDMHIRQLRKKLHLSDGLVTIPKLGYRLESRKGH